MSVENTNSLRHTILQPKTGIVHLGLGVFSGACCALLIGGYSYQGETGELMICQRSPGK